MKNFPTFAGALAWLLMVTGSFAHANEGLQAGQALAPELGIYVEIDEDKWGASEINLRIVNNNFQFFFLDADKLLVDPPIPSVIVHYGNFIKDSNAKETVLLQQEGLMLTSKRVIPPPHRYMVRIFLKKTVPPEYSFEEPEEVKEFIGMHVLNQLGGEELYEKTHTPPTSIPVEETEDAEEALEAAGGGEPDES